MSIYIYVYIYIYICLYIYIYIYMIRSCKNIRHHTCMYIYIYVILYNTVYIYIYKYGMNTKRFEVIPGHDIPALLVESVVLRELSSCNREHFSKQLPLVHTAIKYHSCHFRY